MLSEIKNAWATRRFRCDPNSSNAVRVIHFRNITVHSFPAPECSAFMTLRYFLRFKQYRGNPRVAPKRASMFGQAFGIWTRGR